MAPESSAVTTSQRKSGKDHVTPHKLALLVLIREFCVVKNKARMINPLLGQTDDVWEHTNLQQRDFAIITLKLLQSPDMDLKSFNGMVKPILHPRTYQQFLERLEKLKTKGVAAIMDYFESLENLLVDPTHQTPTVNKSSILGLFIRRMFLVFDKFTFSHVANVHRKFCQYYNTAFGEEQPNDSLIDESLPIDDYREMEETQVMASQKQAEFFIAQQVALLHINEREALPPPKLHQKIRDFHKGNPELTEAHYLSFLNNLRVREFCGAIESLYHHFDRSTLIVPQDSKAVTVAEETTRSFRYAALNLAILHAKFGHREEGLAALKEAITMAQEANDSICLQHSLCWLYRLSPQNAEPLIEKSISKSGELNLWYLSSLSVKALAQLKCFKGTTPSFVFELMMKSDILNCQHSMTELLGSAYSQRAALWTLYGNSCMANLSSQLLLNLNTTDPVRGGIYQIGEGYCLALRNLAWDFALQGHYSEADEIIALAKDLFPSYSEHSHIWKLCEVSIVFEKALLQGEWQVAEKASVGISVLNQLEGQFRKAQLLLHQGVKAAAHSLIQALISACEQEAESLAFFHVRILLLEAGLYLQSPNVSVAISCLTRSLAICKENHYAYLEAITVLYLAAAQFLLKLPYQALQLLDSVFLTILSHGSLYDKARTHLLYAKSVVAAAKLDEGPESYQKALRKGVEIVGTAVILFQQLLAHHHAKDALYWQAQFYHELGMYTERNKWSHQFNLLSQQTSHQLMDEVFVL
ncbi:anaphase promoting complex subunit 5 ida isoform X1 [Tachypleus tridentatus]|uniref:anaphase promoting complex subunit 5 ida isoform X1 n=1 Tax=Tachypleus tridentatus TaxID=6853 RepID=UPI003FD47B6B